ncbi:unnamed protein product [Blepharisma stoltei]|uniref:Lebercilin domain-containing protein n=1 Tax=Blepharisma stoltei TaxID=1481888 RepID=A0AAU9JJG1_9CILI|nr:unnamed protein product [Blepharisma stoltei]
MYHLRKEDPPRIQKEILSRTNQYYIAQVNQMEIKISELKAQLEAKNKEIQYLTNKLERAEEHAQMRLKEEISASNRTVKELETKIAILEEENRQLKLQVNHNQDQSDIKIELEYALRMKQIFEEKYREAKSLQLRADMKRETQSQEPRSSLNKSQLFDLQQELENAHKEKEKAQRHASLTDEENKKLHKKVEELDKTNAELNRKYITSLLKIRDLESRTSLENSQQVEEDSQAKNVDLKINTFMQEETMLKKTPKIVLPKTVLSSAPQKTINLIKNTKEMAFARPIKTIKDRREASHHQTNQPNSEPPKTSSIYAQAIHKGLSVFNQIPKPLTSSTKSIQNKKTVKFPDVVVNNTKNDFSTLKRNQNSSQSSSPKTSIFGSPGILKNKQSSIEKQIVPNFTITLDKSSSNDTFGDEFPDEDELNT